MIENVEETNAAVWMVAALLSVGTLLCISAALWLRERGLLRLEWFCRRRPFAEIALIAVIVGGFVHHGATKTNGVQRSGHETADAQERVPPSENAEGGSWFAEAAGWGQPARPMRTGGGLCFVGIEPQTNGVALAIALPIGGVTGNALDLFCTTNLLAAWSLLGEVSVISTVVTADVFVAMSDLPDSSTNMPRSAFFNIGTHDDADGDGLYDGRERIVYRTDPLRPDTDGDGLSDGAEVVVATSPLLRDTDGDGYPDDEEIAASMNPLVANPGASGTIRYVYDDDDRLAATYVGADGGASLTACSSTGDPVATSERGLEE